MRVRFIAFVCVAAIGAGAARADSLAGAGLRESIAGKTVLIMMSLGSLPVAYRTDGTMSAQSRAAGVATGVAKDTGRWWVSGNNLCQKWRKWFSGQQYCHAMSKKGEILHWVRDDGLSGTAKTLR